MSWTTRYDLFMPPRSRDATPKALNVNDACFIRKDHRCGKIFGASKSCFIACPTDDGLETILELMSEKLAKVGIEPIIAVKERAYGQDIFCTKICGRIIESRFCIVILDDTVTDGTNIPNPNVYYEYGLMTSLRKHIIPLQKEDLTLAFNIQSYDTIKYTSRNIGSELDRAIRDAIKITEAREPEPEKTHFRDRTVMRRLELAGLQVRDEKWFLSEVINDTNFRGFGQYDTNFYAYIAKIDSGEDLQPILEDLDVVPYRTEKKVADLAATVKQAQRTEQMLKEKMHAKKQKAPGPDPFNDRFAEREIAEARATAKERSGWIKLMNTIYVGFIVDPEVDRADLIARAKAVAEPYERYELTVNTDDSIQFGELVVGLSPAAG